MKVTLNTDTNVVLTGRLGDHVDAARSGNIVGIECGLIDPGVAQVQPNDYRAPNTLLISTDPAHAEALMYALANALGLPAFNEREWREIHARLAGLGPTNRLARRIRDAYGWPS